MKRNFFKSTCLALVFLCQIGSFLIAGNSSDNMYSGGGSIIVEGNNLISTSDDPKDSIFHILLISDAGRVYNFNGCRGDICVNDIKSIPTGNYEVIVISSNGGFDDDIYVK